MKGKTRQSLMLVLFLVVFPLISWVYLRFGMDYRIRALEKLEDHGVVSDYSILAEGGDSLRFSDISGTVIVATFFGLRQDSLFDLYSDHLQKLHGQFGGRPDVMFLQHVLDSEPGEKALADIRSGFDLEDSTKVRFVFPDQEQARALMAENYHLPDYDPQDPGANPMIALVDTSHVIRRYYDVREEASMRELVEHLAIVIPRIKERDLVFIREKEK